MTAFDCGQGFPVGNACYHSELFGHGQTQFGNSDAMIRMRIVTPLRPLLLIFIVALSAQVASAQEAVVRYITDDDTPPISAIEGYIPLGPDSAIVADNTGALFLLVSDRKVRVIGQQAAGPCAHTDVTSFAVAGDTVFVLDRRLGRITGYEINSGTCLMEVRNPELSRFRRLGRLGGWFYLVDTNYSAATPEGESLLYRINASSMLESLALTKSSIAANLMPMPLVFGRSLVYIKDADGILFLVLPQTHRIWKYNTRNAAVSFIELEHDSPDFGPVKDFSQASEVLSEIEMELDLFLLADQIAVFSTGAEGVRLSLYSYEGDLMARGPVSETPMFSSGNKLYALVSTESESQPYEIRVVEPPPAR